MCAIDIVECRKPLTPRGELQLRPGDRLALQIFLENFSVLDEAVGFTVHDPVEIRMGIQEANHDTVDDEQRSRSDQSPGERIIGADDGVLNRVRQQQHHEIEGIQLGQLALREAKTDKAEKTTSVRSSFSAIDIAGRKEGSAICIGGGVRAGFETRADSGVRNVRRQQ